MSLNSLECRLLRIKRLTQDQLTELHRREDAAEKRWWDVIARDSRQRLGYAELLAVRGEGWEVTGERYLAACEHSLPPFWPPRMTESEKSRILEGWKANKAVRYACVLASDLSKPELDSIHSADLHHWRYGPVVAPRHVEPVEPTGGRHDYAND